VPQGLKRYQEADDLHFLTFSCYRRAPLLATPQARRVFEETLERVRRWYGLCVFGYVAMPEHVHLLVSEPERSNLAVAIQMLKQITAEKLRSRPTLSPKTGEKDGAPREKGKAPQPFWQSRYYDFNVWTTRKHVEKLRYMHRNPVKRGLVAKPEDWEWSSFRHYMTGDEGVVEIESEWTGRKRERMGISPKVRVRPPMPTLSPTAGEKDGAPQV
jgi:putative transposase